MSPESVRKLEYTRFSDIWSLGCTVIEMCTGEPPWNEYKNPMTVLYNIFNSKIPPIIPINVSNELKDFLECCLKIEPSERLNVFQLLTHPFITGDIIISNKQEPFSHYSNDVNKFSSNHNRNNNNFNNNFHENLVSNNLNNNSSNFLNNFNSKNSEIYNKNMNSEFAMK